MKNKKDAVKYKVSYQVWTRRTHLFFFNMLVMGKLKELGNSDEVVAFCDVIIGIKHKLQKYADAFYEKFIGKEKMFIDFLDAEVVNGVPNSFPASWSYIKNDLHSLERHTNLHIFFYESSKTGRFSLGCGGRSYDKI